MNAKKVTRDIAATPNPIQAQLSFTKAATASAGPGKLNSDGVLWGEFADVVASCLSITGAGVVGGSDFDFPGEGKGDGRGDPKELCWSDGFSDTADMAAGTALG